MSSLTLRQSSMRSSYFTCSTLSDASLISATLCLAYHRHSFCEIECSPLRCIVNKERDNTTKKMRSRATPMRLSAVAKGSNVNVAPWDWHPNKETARVLEELGYEHGKHWRAAASWGGKATC